MGYSSRRMNNSELKSLHSNFFFKDDHVNHRKRRLFPLIYVLGVFLEFCQSSENSLIIFRLH